MTWGIGMIETIGLVNSILNAVEGTLRFFSWFAGDCGGGGWGWGVWRNCSGWWEVKGRPAWNTSATPRPMWMEMVTKLSLQWAAWFGFLALVIFPLPFEVNFAWAFVVSWRRCRMCNTVSGQYRANFYSNRRWVVSESCSIRFGRCGPANQMLNVEMSFIRNRIVGWLLTTSVEASRLFILISRIFSVISWLL